MIRNFSIIAHINHGKSTLSDRIIEYCGGLTMREMQAQVLDSMEIERERGITIKSQTVRLQYHRNGVNHVLNLMDTPGHVDFSYEVSRSLAACEGSVLLVDATQGVQAQTLSNAYKAIAANHIILPCINKIDLPSSDPNACIKQIEDVIGIDATHATMISAKTGDGIKELLDSIIDTIPMPDMNIESPTKVLLVDAWYDSYLGVIMLIRVVSGILKKHNQIRMIHTKTVHTVEKIGVFTPKKEDVEQLSAGEIGFICANIKHIADCHIGDTIVLEKDLSSEPLPGFNRIKPAVFCSLYPVVNAEYGDLKNAIEKLRLNDSSIEYEYESSAALGSGFRCGFLGLLHMEVIQERLEREFSIDLIATAPNVVYQITMTDGIVEQIHNPSYFPDPSTIKSISEPIAEVTLIVPEVYIGDIMELCIHKRGIHKSMNTYTGNRSILVYHIPLSEIIVDFHDKIKSLSKGYASFEWEILNYQESDIVKVSILINGEAADALSLITHRSRSESRGRNLCLKLKELIPKQMFAVPIQAAIGGKIIARETISAMRKDVTAKCYGGDISRKRKLLDKQKKGKKKMKMLGNVEIPQDAFMAALKIDD